jgi:hypothetical protein
MRLPSLKFIISILITSLSITGCSNPIDENQSIDEYQKNINEVCDSLYLNLEEALLTEDPLEIEDLMSDLVFRSLSLSSDKFSDYENVENNPYYLKAKNSLNSINERFVKSIFETLTLSDEFISAMNKFFIVDCKKGDSIDPVKEDAKGNREACRIYDETVAEAMQLPFGSPKLSYILDNGYTEAIRYADADLALNFQILIDGNPGSSSVIFDVNEICDPYR